MTDTTTPILHANGNVTINTTEIGVWATIDGRYRFVPSDFQVKPFTIKGPVKFIKRIKEVYDV